jgi:predicted NBD/HSP70 family sugar kinase
LTAKEISLAASGVDKCAQECLTVYQDRLARSLAVVINLLDPDLIVLGGGLSNIVQPYAGLSALVGIYTFSDGIDTPIVRATPGDSSGSNWRSKSKRATLSKDAIRHVWKRRPFGFKRKGQRGDLHTGPSSGTQPLGAGDDASSQGRQDNDFEAPQATQSSVLFPLPN